MKKNEKVQIVYTGKPIFSSIFLIILLIIFLGNSFFDNYINYFLIHPSYLFEPENWYRFIAYALYRQDLSYWIGSSIFIFASGYIIESRFKPKILFLLILINSLAGGLTKVLYLLYLKMDLSMAGAMYIDFGLMFYANTILLFKWKKINLAEKTLSVFFSIIILLMFTSQVFKNEDQILIMSILVSINLVLVYVLKDEHKSKNAENEINILDQDLEN